MASLVAVTLSLPGCGGGSSGTVANASLSGSVVDGKVSGATLTLYSDLAMTTQVGTGSTDSTGAFSVTLTVTTAPDPIYIKSVGGTDIDTGMPAPTMFFVGNTTGANALTTFNITPLTLDVFNRLKNGDTLANAQTNAQTAFGLASNTGTNGLYEDPTAAGNTTLKAAAFKKLSAGTVGATLKAGSYKMFAIIVSQSDIANTAIANAAAIPTSNNFVSGSITVAADGTITGTGGGGTVMTGKVVGASVVMNILDNATTPTSITRVVGNMGLNGSIAGNFTDVTQLNTVGKTPAMNKGMFVGSLVPTSGIKASGLATFVSNFYSPGALTGTPLTGSSTGMMNIIARDVFTNNVPRVYWGRSAVTAVNVAGGTVTMSNMVMRNDAGSVAAAGTTTMSFVSGTYVSSGGIPTNMLIFDFQDPGATMDLYVCTAVGLRRGIYFVVPTAGNPGAGIIQVAGESYMSKVDSLAPNPFVLGHTYDITVGSINPGMVGATRTNALTYGITPQKAGPMTLPAGLTGATTMGNGYWDTTTGAPELMVFQGSMFVMKKDVANTFATNQFTTPPGADTHMRVVEFYDSGAMQGEEIEGGNVPGGVAPPGSTSILMRDYPGNFVGFVHDQASAVTPSFSGTLHFLARSIYASSYTGFANAYTSGSLDITAPTTTAGSATLVATPAGGTSATSTLTVAVPATGEPGVYHIYGALTGGGYIDIVWPIGGTKGLYMISASSTGNVSEIGEAYLTQ